MRIAITIGGVRVEAELAESATARGLRQAMPFTSKAQTWGEEVYFATPVKAQPEKDARQVVEPGTVCFWCEGDSIALPYGRTPISTDERPKLANPCSVLGRLLDDPRALARVRSGDAVTVDCAVDCA